MATYKFLTEGGLASRQRVTQRGSFLSLRSGGMKRGGWYPSESGVGVRCEDSLPESKGRASSRWLRPVILATQEAEIRRIMV
jgi:hypothetical protein